LKLLLDHNLSPRLAKALDALFVEHQIVALRDKFPANVTDVDWITALDREGGWTVVTKDIGIGNALMSELRWIAHGSSIFSWAARGGNSLLKKRRCG
jgi:predicted nuclease of predicted toxin-antitoxin system